MTNLNSNKNFNDIFLLEALRILRSYENKIARKIIYEAYLDYKKSNNFDIFKISTIKKCADLVKGDLDEIGFLVEFNYLNKDHFLALYSDVVRRVWISLEEEILCERKLRKNSSFQDNKKVDIFLKYFESLAQHAKKYREEKDLSEPTFIDFRNLD